MQGGRFATCACAILLAAASAHGQSPPPRTLDATLRNAPQRRGAFFELHGYLRLRSDLFSNYTFGGSADRIDTTSPGLRLQRTLDRFTELLARDDP